MMVFLPDSGVASTLLAGDKRHAAADHLTEGGFDKEACREVIEAGASCFSDIECSS